MDKYIYDENNGLWYKQRAQKSGSLCWKSGIMRLRQLIDGQNASIIKA